MALLHPAPAAPSLGSPWPARPAHGVWLMGIVNATPDSFSDGGQWAAVDAAITQAKRLANEGADIIDIGGESTRPGAQEVDAATECMRILPVIEGLRDGGFSTPLSVDTYKAETAEKALLAGASIINDVWGLQRDPEMADVVARYNAGLVIMHNRVERDEKLDILGDIEAFFRTSIASAEKAGISKNRIVLDPGIGFGKTFEQNLVVLRGLPRLHGLGYPLLLGTSRKGFLGLITGREVTNRADATLASSAFGLASGVALLRVHDMAAHYDLARVFAALKDPDLP